MNGKVYAINRDASLIGIETELHGFTVAELVTDVDVQIGDQLFWDCDLAKGEQRYQNRTTGCELQLLVRNHLIGRDALRRELQMGH